MKIGFFTMPVHRLGRNYTECLQEDRDAVILADKLGFSEAYVGEHLTDAAENITNAMLFQASLISETKQIKLGTGTTNLSHTHPVLVAAQAAMLDHLLQGRFILESARVRSSQTLKHWAFEVSTAIKCLLNRSPTFLTSGGENHPTI